MALFSELNLGSSFGNIKTASVKVLALNSKKKTRHGCADEFVPTYHVMVSMALTNQRRSSQGRKTSYGTERALSTARLSGPWTNRGDSAVLPSYSGSIVNFRYPRNG